MKKLSLLGFLVAMSGVSHASEMLPEIKADCETLKLSMGNSISTEVEVVPYWKNAAVFPNPPTEGSAGKDGKPYSITCPHLSISDDGNVVEVKAKNYKELVSLIPSYSQNMNFTGLVVTDIRILGKVSISMAIPSI